MSTKGQKRGRKKSDILRSLDMRKRQYVKKRLSGKSKKRAALEAGYSESMAENAGVKIESAEVRRAFQELARKAVPAAKIVERLEEGMDAVKPVISGGRVRREPDFRERREYLLLAAKFGGHYVEERQVDLQGKVNVIAPGKRIRELLARAGSRGAAVSE